MKSLGEMFADELATEFGLVRLAIIPTGSTEQHGSNMCFSTDTMIASELAKRVAERLAPRALVVPAVPWGVSYHHMKSRGTLTLSPDTFDRVLLDLVRSLSEHGIKKVLVLNGHGGNFTNINNAACKAKEAYGVEMANIMHFRLIRRETLDRISSKRWGHSCEVEVSLGMYLCPSSVTTRPLLPGANRSYPYDLADPADRGSTVVVPYMMEDISDNGMLGDARQASLEFGRDLTDDIVDGCVRFAESFIKE